MTFWRNEHRKMNIERRISNKARAHGVIVPLVGKEAIVRSEAKIRTGNQSLADCARQPVGLEKEEWSMEKRRL